MTPGRGPAASDSHRVLGGDLGAALGAPLAGPGLESRGPRLGAARDPLSPGSRGSAGGAAPAPAGFRAPAAANGSVPHCPAPPPSASPVSGPSGPRTASRRRRGPWSRATPGGRAGPGGRADPTDPPTERPQRRHLPPALRRLGGAGPARAPARAPPQPPASSAPVPAARLRRPPLPAAKRDRARGRRTREGA